MKRHKWMVVGVAQEVCSQCGAWRWGRPGGWGRAMKNGRPAKYCDAK